MVTIPRIGIPTDVPLRAQPTPELNLPGGEDWRIAGQAFRLAGQVVGAVDAKLLERDRIAAKEHETGYRQELGGLSDPDEGFYSLRGDDAVKAADATRKRVQDARLKGREGLSGRAARMYDDITLAREADALEGIDRWTEQQQRARDDQVSGTRVGVGVSEFQSGIQSDDPETQTKALASLASAGLELMELRKRQGMPDEVTAEDRRKLEADAWTGAVEAAIDGDPYRADRILRSAEPFITDKGMFGKLRKKVDDAMLGRDALTLAAGQDVAGSAYDMSGLRPGAEQTLHKVFAEAGLSDIAQAALIGNGIHESGLDPARVNPRDQKDGSPSTALFQWDPHRLKAGQAWAAANGLDWNSLETQGRFAVHELKTAEPAAYRRLVAAKTAAEANAAVQDYLRPGNWRRGGDPTVVNGHKERMANTLRILGKSRPALAALPAGVMTIEGADAHARNLAAGDPKKLVVYRDVFRGEVAGRRAAQDQRERDARDDLFEFYKNNPSVRSWQQVPASIRNRLSNEDAVAQRSYWSQQATGGVKTDPDTYLDLNRLAATDRAEFVRLDLRQFKDRLNDDDLRDMSNLQRQAIQGGGEWSKRVVGLEAINRVSEIVMPPELRKRPKEQQVFKAEFLRVATSMGVELNDDQLYRIGRQILQTRFQKSAWFGLTTETSREAAWHATIEDVPVKDRHLIETDWMKKHRGQRPTSDQILSTWRDMQYYGVTR